MQALSVCVGGADRHPKVPRCLIAGQAATLSRFYNALSQIRE
jgi:hypothetical protein